MLDATVRANETPAGPALRYHGSKWRIADWIISRPGETTPQVTFCVPENLGKVLRLDI